MALYRTKVFVFTEMQMSDNETEWEANKADCERRAIFLKDNRFTVFLRLRLKNTLNYAVRIAYREKKNRPSEKNAEDFLLRGNVL